MEKKMNLKATIKSTAGMILGVLGASASPVLASASEWKANSVSQVKQAIEEQQAQTGKNQYKIQYGDTLWAISEASGIKLNVLISVNKIANKDLIYAGDMLTFTESAITGSGKDTSIVASTDSKTGDTVLYRSTETKNENGRLDTTTEVVDMKDLTKEEIKEVIKSNPDLAEEIGKVQPDVVKEVQEEIKEEATNPVVEETTEAPVTEPEVTEPEVTEPEVTEPEVTEPEVTEPPVTEAPVEETTVVPNPTEPEETTVEETTVEETTVTYEEEVIEDVVDEPEVTEPEVTEPEVTEPEVTEPEVTEPEVTEPPVTEAPKPLPDPSQMVNFGDYVYVGYAYTWEEADAIGVNALTNILNDDGGQVYNSYFVQEEGGIVYVYAHLFMQ